MKRTFSIGEVVRASLPPSDGAPLSNHIDENHAIAFYGGGLDPREEEAIRNHLAECATCRELATDAQHYLDSFAEASAASTPKVLPFSPHAVRRWTSMLAAAALVMAAGLLLVFRHAPPPIAQTSRQPVPAAQPRTLSEEVRWRELRVQKAPYTPGTDVTDELIWRGGEVPPSKQSGFDMGMKAYASGDFSGAERALAEHLARNPRDGQASFYRGVSLLMLDRAGEAAAPLQSALIHVRPDRAAIVRWYLAVALLKSGQPALAVEPLEQVAASSGEHSGEAARLLSEARAFLAGPSK